MCVHVRISCCRPSSRLRCRALQITAYLEQLGEERSAQRQELELALEQRAQAIVLVQVITFTVLAAISNDRG